MWGVKQSGNSNGKQNYTQNAQNANFGNLNVNAGTKSFGPLAGCAYCGLPNHDISQCRNLNPNQSRRGGGRFNSGHQPRQQYPYVAWPSNLVANSNEHMNMSEAECNALDSYKQFCSEVGIYSRGGTLRTVQCVRDSCSFQSLACRSMFLVKMLNLATHF